MLISNLHKLDINIKLEAINFSSALAANALTSLTAAAPVRNFIARAISS